MYFINNKHIILYRRKPIVRGGNEASAEREDRIIGYSACYGPIYRTTENAIPATRPVGYSALYGPIGARRKKVLG